MIGFDPIIDNFLDKSFQNVLFPYRCLHHSLFLSRFSVKYNCIRPHGRSYYAFSFIGVVLFIIYSFQFGIIVNSVNSVIDFFFKLNTYTFCIPFIIFYGTNIIQRKNHVELILKIQRALRILKFKDYKNCVLCNWVGVFGHAIWILLCIILLTNVRIAICFYLMSFLDVNTTYGQSMIFLIRKGLAAWISEVEYQSKICLELREKKCLCVFKNLFQAYEDLIDAYGIYKRLFKFSILFQVTYKFILSLFYAQLIIELIKLKVLHAGSFKTEVYAVVFILWLLKNIIYVGLFSACCEKFYICVAQANKTCYNLLRTFQNVVSVKNFCKNVLRYHRATFCKMTAFNIFTVDADLAHGFSSLEAEYIIVLLQFALNHNK